MMTHLVEPAVLSYGWGKVRPGFLQFMNNSKCFLLLVIVFALSQGMTVGGLTSMVLPSIEKRFQFTSKEIGFIAASNDISAIILTCFVSFYGGFGNKPRWLGYGALITGIGCLLYTLPHVIIGPYSPHQSNGVSNALKQPLCYTNTTANKDSSQCFSGYGGNWYYLMIFSIAQMLMGAGTTPLYSLAPAYIDENVHPKSCPVYLGIFFASAIMGPGIGFVAGGAMLEQYVDWKLPKGMNLTPRDPRWIGAWWLGYVVGGVILIVFSMGLLGFSRELPGAREMREKAIKDGNLPEKDEKLKGNLKDMIPATIKLLKNPVFMFNAFALTVSTIYGGGIAPFIAKILWLKFGLNPLKAGILLGVAVIPGCGGGILVGGFLVRRFKLKESLRMAAKYCFIFKMLTMVGSLCWLVPGCQEIQLAGVVKSYWNSPTIDYSLSASCNANCSCSQAQIRPVCGVDQVTYFSPCFAGCTSSSKKGVYSNCSCIPPSFNVTAPDAIKGFCDRGSGCNGYIGFLAIAFVLMLTEFVISIPNKTVVLRSVPDNQRAYALGFQFIFQRSLGFLPGPILFGWLVDSLCLVWGQSCDRRGSCQFYDVNSLSVRLTTIGITVQGIAIILYFLSYWFCRRTNMEKHQNHSTSEGESKEFIIRESAL